MTDLNTPLDFSRGPTMKNRFMLAPLTNCQSAADGTLSDEEYRWLTLRAQGGFGLTMTCAAHVQQMGQGFPGQLGVWSDQHIEGLTRLAAGIGAHDSISIVQLHHAGNRSPEALIGAQPVCPSDDPETGARALSVEEVVKVRDDFIAGAVRAEQAGFDGVELHGAHGYLLCQFFSEELNKRDDEYGGSTENRFRLLHEIIAGIRTQCSDNFMLGLRLSPERFGMRLGEIREVAQDLMMSGNLEFLDMSLWDTFKPPVEDNFADRTLIECFTELQRGNTRLGVAGKLRNPAEVEAAIAQGADWVMLGRAAILQHDFPQRYADNPTFEPVRTPVTRSYLNQEGLSDTFVEYMNNWKGFVADAS